jgi:hypothetical protein
VEIYLFIVFENLNKKLTTKKDTDQESVVVYLKLKKKESERGAISLSAPHGYQTIGYNITKAHIKKTIQIITVFR